jgi:hypothetical protein
MTSNNSGGNVSFQLHDTQGSLLRDLGVLSFTTSLSENVKKQHKIDREKCLKLDTKRWQNVQHLLSVLFYIQAFFLRCTNYIVSFIYVLYSQHRLCTNCISIGALQFHYMIMYNV